MTCLLFSTSLHHSWWTSATSMRRWSRDVDFVRSGHDACRVNRLLYKLCWLSFDAVRYFARVWTREENPARMLLTPLKVFFSRFPICFAYLSSRVFSHDVTAAMLVSQILSFFCFSKLKWLKVKWVKTLYKSLYSVPRLILVFSARSRCILFIYHMTRTAPRALSF